MGAGEQKPGFMEHKGATPTTVSKYSCHAAPGNARFGCGGARGCHLRWAFLHPLLPPSLRLLYLTGPDHYLGVKPPPWSPLCSHSFRAPVFSADFHPVQSRIGFQTSKPTNKQTKALLSFQCVRIHVSDRTFRQWSTAVRLQTETSYLEFSTVQAQHSPTPAPVSNLKDINPDGFAGVLGMFHYEAAPRLPGADTCVFTVPLGGMTPEADISNSLSFINS